MPDAILLLIVLVFIASAILVSIHILLNKRNAYAAALWLAFAWLLPVFGVLLYWSFGVNRVARKARRRQKPMQSTSAGTDHSVPEQMLPLLRIGDSLSPRSLLAGNTVELLVDGDATYPAMLDAIAHAEKSLGFVSYIFDEDEVGLRFEEALQDAAARGVQVRLLVDGIGAWGLGPRLYRDLGAVGGRVASFWPRGRWLKHPGLNLRNHRKILVVDGRLGFTGGLNVSARHTTMPGADGPASRDLHFRVRGPVVKHLVEAFVDDWEMATGEVLNGSFWFPELLSTGDVLARGIPSGPDFTLGKLHELLLGAMRTARHRIDLMSPYFIPDGAILASLRAASRSGVRVRLILPRKTDHRFMAWAARAYLWELVESGVEVWEVTDEFVHAKLAVIDDHWALFGSANLDPRSFRLNFEFNVEAWSESLAKGIRSYMNHFQGRARRVGKKQLRRETIAVRLRNQAVKLFTPYL
jgi:cardiolipin synthase